MKTNSENASLLKQPSAWIPVAISLAALTLVLGYVTIFGIVQHTDEGTPAHIFQLLMVVQLPIIAYFALKWLPKRPIQTLVVPALQAGARMIPIFTVMWLESLS